MQFWLPREPAEQLGGAWKVMQLLVLSKTSGRSSRAFFSSIPHQKAVQGDKPAIHHEDGAKDTNHPLSGELNFSPITSMEAALSKQCSVWRPGYGNKVRAHTGWILGNGWFGSITQQGTVEEMCLSELILALKAKDTYFAALGTGSPCINSHFCNQLGICKPMRESFLFGWCTLWGQKEETVPPLLMVKQTSVELLVDPFWPSAYHSLSLLEKSGRLWTKSRDLGLKTRIWTFLGPTVLGALQSSPTLQPCSGGSPQAAALPVDELWAVTDSQQVNMNAAHNGMAEKSLTRQQHWDHRLEVLRPTSPKNHQAAKFFQIRHTLMGLKIMQSAHTLKDSLFFNFILKLCIWKHRMTESIIYTAVFLV